MPDAVLFERLFLPGLVIYAGKMSICSPFICCFCTVSHKPPSPSFIGQRRAFFSTSTKNTVLLPMSNRVCFPTDVLWRLCEAVCGVEENDSNPLAFQASRCLPPWPLSGPTRASSRLGGAAILGFARWIHLVLTHLNMTIFIGDIWQIMVPQNNLQAEFITVFIRI